MSSTDSEHQGSEPQQGAEEPEKKTPPPQTAAGAPEPHETGDDLPPANLKGNLGLLLLMVAVVVLAFVLMRVFKREGPTKAAAGKVKPSDFMEEWKREKPKALPVPAAAAKGEEPSAKEGEKRELTWDQRRQIERAAALATRAVVAGDPALVLIMARPPMERPDRRVEQMLLFDVSKLAKGVQVQDLIPEGFWHEGQRFADQLPVIGVESGGAPRYVTAGEAGFLGDGQRVVGVSVGGASRAYPIGVMNIHLLALDRVGDRDVFVAWNPFTQSAGCYDRSLDGKTLDWRFSARVYMDDYVYYDRDGALWDSGTGQGLSGATAGKWLTAYATTVTTWKYWREKHPDTLVLSFETGYPDVQSQGLYESDQFVDQAKYLEQPNPAYTVPEFRPDKTPLPAKAFVVGLSAGESRVAVPFAALAAATEAISVQVGGKTVRIGFDKAAATPVFVALPEGVSAKTTLWFAWFARQPNTRIFPDKEAEK